MVGPSTGPISTRHGSAASVVFETAKWPHPGHVSLAHQATTQSLSLMQLPACGHAAGAEAREVQPTRTAAATTAAWKT